MPYLGKSPQHGNYSKLDDFSGDFDGSDATHAIASNGTAITPVRPEALIISINGVIQEPVTDYTVSGTNITFTTAPTAGDNFFGVAMGEQLQIGTPSDATITSAKLSGNLTTPGTLTVTNSASITGTTPTLTIGDAGAEDAKIVFDGNAQDFHIGLDDTADDLVIGKGSALGTTTHMAFTENGEITKPLNPYFNAKSILQSNVTGDNTGYTVLFATEQDDVGANYNTSNGTFTAPVTGNYQFNAFIQGSGYSGNETMIQMYFNTSNEGSQDYDTHVPNAAVTNLYGAGVTTFSASAAFQMDASDTIIVQFYVNGTGGKTVDVSAHGVFSGYLIG